MTLPKACVLTHRNIPLKHALALTEQSAMAMFFVHVLNRLHMAWAAVSGAKFVPLCSFRGYLCDLLLVDSLCSSLTTGLCVSHTAKFSQLYAIRLQNAGDVHQVV